MKDINETLKIELDRLKKAIDYVDNSKGLEVQLQTLIGQFKEEKQELGHLKREVEESIKTLEQKTQALDEKEKEYSIAQDARFTDEFDRLKSDLCQSINSELADVKQEHEKKIETLSQTCEVNHNTLKLAFETECESIKEQLLRDLQQKLVEVKTDIEKEIKSVNIQVEEYQKEQEWQRKNEIVSLKDDLFMHIYSVMTQLKIELDQKLEVFGREYFGTNKVSKTEMDTEFIQAQQSLSESFDLELSEVKLELDKKIDDIVYKADNNFRVNLHKSIKAGFRWLLVKNSQC